MTRYLVIATLLWACALLVYELGFRRLRLHAENRTYLLASLALGLLLPRLQVPVPHSVPDPVQITVRRSMDAQAQLTGAIAGAPADGPDAAGWLPVLYLAGAACMVAWLAWQGVLLARLLRGARREVLLGTPVLRTRGAHSPFSFLGRIAIPAGADYPADELRMILLHEGAHLRLRHSLDILALQALRVAFWFHPLVHLYYRRLRMVHEFQADAAQRDDAAAYGHFLINQAMLAAAPAMAHSFLQSPLKTRIAMLIKTSRATRLRYLAALMLLPVFVVCTAYLPGLKRVRDGNKVRFNGHVLVKSLYGAADTIVTMSPVSGQETRQVVADGAGSTDTIVTMDPVSGQALTRVKAAIPADTIITALDDQKVYGVYELQQKPRYNGPGNSLAMQLFTRLKRKLETLPDGSYQLYLDRVVVDANGRIVYFESNGLHTSFMTIMLDANGKEAGTSFGPITMVGSETRIEPAAKKKSVVSDALSQEVENLLEEEFLTKARYTPAMVNGKAVASRLDGDETDFMVNRLIVVKDHRATLSVGKRGEVVNH